MLEGGFGALFPPTVFVAAGAGSATSSSIGLHVTESPPSPPSTDGRAERFLGEMEDGDRKLFPEDDDGDDDADTAIALFTP